MRRFRWMSLVLGAVLAVQAAPALAITTQSSQPVTLDYVAAFQPTFRGTLPYSGTMTLTFRQGIVSGQYRDMSIRPGGPLQHGAILAVTGGTSGGNINLRIGSSFHVNGTLAKDGTIQGTATYGGRLYDFLAVVGKPGGG